MKIKKLDNHFYSVITDTLLSDGTYKQDHLMILNGQRLESFEDGKSIRVGGLIQVILGAKAFRAITGLKVNEEIQL